MNIIWKILRTIASVCLILLVMAICWTAAYYITSYLYDRIGVQPSDLVRQLVNSMVGFVIFGLLMLLISYLTLPKRMAMFNTIIDAMRGLSQGDFNVTLNIKMKVDNQFSQLVRSFNDMGRAIGRDGKTAAGIHFERIPRDSITAYFHQGFRARAQKQPTERRGARPLSRHHRNGEYTVVPIE